MLFKNLKAIINEADAAPTDAAAPADGAAPAIPASPLKRQPAKTIKVSQENSDGVGHETYKLSVGFDEDLLAQLKTTFGLNSIASFGVVNKMYNVTFKPGNPDVNEESVKNTVMMALAVELNGKIDNVDLQISKITDIKYQMAFLSKLDSAPTTA